MDPEPCALAAQQFQLCLLKGGVGQAAVLTSVGSMPSSRNCCRERTSLLLRLWLGLPAPVARRTCRGLWWEEREEVGCCTGLLPLLDHTSCSRLRLNSPLLSLCGLLRLPFSVPADEEEEEEVTWWDHQPFFKTIRAASGLQLLLLLYGSLKCLKSSMSHFTHPYCQKSGHTFTFII